MRTRTPIAVPRQQRFCLHPFDPNKSAFGTRCHISVPPRRSTRSCSMPRTKANVIAAVARKKAELVQKAAQPVGAEKRKAKRSRMWRTNWFRQVRHAQSNKAAGLNYLNAAGMSRLVREISAKQRPDYLVRWKPEAIMALRGECDYSYEWVYWVRIQSLPLRALMLPARRGGTGADYGDLQGGQRHHRDLWGADDCAEAVSSGGAVSGDGAAFAEEAVVGGAAARPIRERAVIRWANREN